MAVEDVVSPLLCDRAPGAPEPSVELTEEGAAIVARLLRADEREEAVRVAAFNSFI